MVVVMANSNRCLPMARNISYDKKKLKICLILFKQDFTVSWRYRWELSHAILYYNSFYVNIGADIGPYRPFF